MILAILIAVFTLLVVPGLSIWALVQARTTRAELEALAAQTQRALDELARLGSQAPPSEAVAPPPPPPPPPAPAPLPPPPPRPAWQAVPAAAAGRPRDGFEKSLTSRWLVWTGAVALALAGVFLVKYSIEKGWLSPPVRCAAGVVLGVLLVIAGEWLRRQPLQRAIAAVQANYIPPALTAAGVATLYASIYAAHALYALLPGVVAFILLAIVSALAFGLALLQGALIAVLGVIGAMAVPALVSTGQDSALALFSFLVAVIGAALWILRYRAWWQVAWLALAGATLWPLGWFMFAWHPADSPVMAVYLLAAATMFLLLGRPQAREATPAPGFMGLATSDPVALAAALAFALLTFVLVRVDGYEAPSLIALAALSVLYMAVGRRHVRFDVLAVVAFAVMLALIALWHLPQVSDTAGRTLGVTGWRYDLGRGAIVPPTLLPFAMVTGLFAALFAGGGFIALWGARRPAVWAHVSAAAPVLVLAIAFWRVQKFEIDLAWAAAGLVVAGIELLAAERVARHRDARGMAGVLAAYAMGVAAGLGLALAMALRQAWLTAALALLVPALAVIHDRLPLAAIRRVAWIAAAAVTVRLVLNYRIFDYDPGPLPGAGWMIYGYGVPMVAFAWAAIRFRRRGDGPLVHLLEAGAITFAALFVALEIRQLITGDIALPSYSLAERALQSGAWLALAWGLYRRHQMAPRPVLGWAWRILAGLGAAHVLLIQVLFANPLFEAAAVGDWPVVNLLLLAYGAPALIAFLFAAAAQGFAPAAGGEAAAPRSEARWLVPLGGGAGLVLLFVWLSLEVRRAFHGSVLASGTIDGLYVAVLPTSDAEWYAYSVAWLAYAAALLALAIWREVAALRYASLALVMLTVAKLFVFDMSELTGLYRVASFLGLGLALVGIGYLYQRYVFPPRRVAAPPG